MMNNEVMNNEIVTINRADIAPADMMTMLQNPTSSFFCSIHNDGSRKAAVRIYNAINNKGKSLDEMAKEVIYITDVAAHPVTITDEKTGEVIETLRIVLIDKDGNNYDAVSQGIASSLQKIFAIVGTPTFEPALPVRMVKQKTRRGFYTSTLELVDED